MKRTEAEEKFLEYLEQSLPEEEMKKFSILLENNAELRKSFRAYRQVVDTENIIASEKRTASPHFAVKVLSKIEHQEYGFIRRLFMEMVQKQRFVYAAVASLATLVIILKTTQSGIKETGLKEQMLQHWRSETAPVSVSSGPVIAMEMPEGKDDNSAGTKKLSDDLSNKPAESRSDNAIVAKPDLSAVKSKLTGNAAAAPEAKSFERSTEILKEKIELDGARAADERLLSPPPPALPALRKPADIAYIEPHHGSYGGADNEGYIPYTENPRISVSQQPSSTFSIDVDTASYTNARRFLKNGQLPPGDSVRIEEFINYFDYNYPVQHEKPFTLSYEIAPSPLEPDRHLLKLGIKARDAAAQNNPWNIVFLIDVSGSMMDQNKLPLVKQAMKLLVNKMRDSDRISIVTYAGSAGVALAPSSIKDKSRIIAAIDGLAAGGSTYGSGGINAAYDLAMQSRISGGVNRVVLATDGDFNVGVTSHDELIRLIEEKRKSGITLTGLGFGTGNIKDGTLEQLANKGNGNYFYIDSFQEARKVLETDLAGNMETVAKDVKLQIEFNPEKIANYRLIGYENRKLNREDFNNDLVDAGEIGTGHTVTAIYEVVLAESELARNMSEQYRYQNDNKSVSNKSGSQHISELAFLKIRYKEPEGSNSKLLQYPIEEKDIRTGISQTSDDFRFAAAVSYFAQLLRGSQFAAGYSFDEVLKLAESSRGNDKNGYRQELIELIKDAKAIKN